MPLPPVFRPLLALMSAFLLAIGLIGPLFAQTQEPHVLVMTVDGIINPVKERFIARAIDRAVEDGAELVVVHLDTPGGLLSSTRIIVEELLESPVPVAVFVSPKGARAGSAGTFITAAANFAVMAPGSNIGAATPVSSTGGDLDDTLASKVENDAAALIRSIAQERGRNQDLLEATVREAASYSAIEAVESNVVDFIAEDLDDLLAQLHGQTADTARGPQMLDTLDLERRSVNKNVVEHLLEFISDPNVSFILLTVGGLGIVVELFNPGLIVPAVVGVICLLLAFLALGNLPYNWAGVVFILLAAVLAGFEVAVAGFGVLGIGSAVCLIVGGLLLFAQFGDASPTLPPVAVNRWLVGATGAAAALTAVYFLQAAVRSRHPAQPESGAGPGAGPGFVGMTGVVTARLEPRGVVAVANEAWTAVSEGGTVIEIGEPVIIVARDGLILTVTRQNVSNV